MQEIHLYSGGADPFLVEWNGMRLIVHFSAPPPTAIAPDAEPKDPKPDDDVKHEEVVLSSGYSGGVLGVSPVSLPDDDWEGVRAWAAAEDDPRLGGLLAEMPSSGGAELVVNLVGDDSEGMMIGHLVDDVRGVSSPDVTLHVATQPQIDD